MAPDELHVAPARGQALGRGHDGALGGAHVGDQRAGRRRPPHGRQQRLVGQHGGGQHDAIGVAQAVGEIGGDPVEGAVGQGRAQPGLVAPDADDLAGDRVGSRGLGERAAQEPDTDDRQPLDHAELFPSTARSALIRRRFSCGVPTEMRRADSMPNGVIGRTMTPSLSNRW